MPDYLLQTRRPQGDFQEGAAILAIPFGPIRGKSEASALPRCTVGFSRMAAGPGIVYCCPGSSAEELEYAGSALSEPLMDKRRTEHLISVPNSPAPGGAKREGVVRAEVLLRTPEADLNEAQRLAHIGNWSWDAATDAVIASAELYRIFGLDPAAGKFPAYKEQRGTLYPVESWDRLNAAVEQTLRTGDGYELDLEARRREQQIWITTRGELVRDAKGRIVGMRGTVQDITERKRAEELLRESRDQIRLISDAVPVLISYVDTERRYRSCNHAYTKWFGLSHDEVIGRTMEEVVGKAAWKTIGPHVEEALAGEVVDYEAHAHYKTGPRWIHAVYTPHHDAQGRVLGIIVMVNDITEHKRAEQALRESEERYRYLFESIDEGFCVIEMIFDQKQKPVDYRFVEVNPAFEKQAGMHGATGKRMLEFVSHIEPHWLENYGRVAMTGEPIRFADEYKSLGSWFDVYAFRVGHPESRRVAVIFNNITQRKKSEIALRESEERFRMMADNISQLAWICDQLGNAIWYNQRWYDYTGTTFDEMRGGGWQRVQHPEHTERVAVNLRRSRETGEVWEDTFPLRGKDGKYRWFLSRALPIRDEQGKIVRWFGTNTDITELREAEAQLAAANEQLASRAKQLDTLVQQRTAKLSETIGELEAFSYSVSHDMRQPLRAMQQYSGILLKDFAADLPPEAQRYLGRIAAGANRMDRLIQDVLTYSRVTRDEVKMEPVDLNKLVCEVVEQYPGFHRPAAEFWVQEPLLPVLGSEAVLAQAISNLFGNAVKFVPPGTKPQIRVWTDPRVSGQTGEPDRVRLWVEDNGIGIAPEHQRRIWEIFERVHPPGKYEGTGIGLSIVRKAVERSGGKAGVESEPGKGSRFWIELPAASPET